MVSIAPLLASIASLNRAFSQSLAIIAGQSFSLRKDGLFEKVG